MNANRVFPLTYDDDDEPHMDAVIPDPLQIIKPYRTSSTTTIFQMEDQREEGKQINAPNDGIFIHTLFF